MLQEDFEGEERRKAESSIVRVSIVRDLGFGFLRVAGASKKGPSHSTMAIGKNKRISKGKKGGEKKPINPSAEDWYTIKAPSMFSVENVGKTLVTWTLNKCSSNHHHIKMPLLSK